jgi:glycosyltransferase involved in cell wall biosynthesis
MSSNSPLRLVHYVPGIRLEQGGVVRAILDWCTVFAARGHQVTLLTYQGNDVPREWLAGRPGNPIAKVIQPPRQVFGKPLGDEALKTAEEAIATADVLHLHAPWLDGNRQLADIARRHNVPYVVTLHGMLDDWSMAQRPIKKRLYMMFQGRRFLAQAACVHCTAEAELAQSKRWFTNDRTAVQPYLIELTAFAERPGPEAGLALVPVALRDRPKVLFLSRLHEQKGIDIAIGAAAAMRDAGQNFALLIAGNGEPTYEQQMRDLVAKLGLRDHVVFLGLVTGEEKISLYRAADVFVLPTRHENFGLVLTEAMACGTPVVTTHGTDIWRELREQAGQRVVDQNAPKGIASAVMELLGKSTEERASVGSRGRAWVFNTLAVEPLAQKYEELYRGVARQLTSPVAEGPHAPSPGTPGEGRGGGAPI